MRSNNNLRINPEMRYTGNLHGFRNIHRPALLSLLQIRKNTLAWIHTSLIKSPNVESRNNCVHIGAFEIPNIFSKPFFGWRTPEIVFESVDTPQVIRMYLWPSSRLLKHNSLRDSMTLHLVSKCRIDKISSITCQAARAVSERSK